MTLMKNIMIVAATSMLLTACGGAGELRKQLGVKKGSPDEFSVLRRAPLEIPPPESLDLPEPRLGAPRPQEKSAEDAARTSLFGVDVAKDTSGLSEGEKSLLAKAEAQNVDPSAGIGLQKENADLHNRNKPVVERLFGFRGDAAVASATVVDASAEAARIKENLEAGNKITDGETPSIEE